LTPERKPLAIIRALAMKGWQILKLPVIALGVPFKMAFTLGHFKSSILRKAVARGGDPLPWYTYPAVHFLSTLNISDLTILEFGGGQSSIWWAQRARSVTTLETDRDWFQEIEKRSKAEGSLECVYCRTEEEQADWPIGSEFDIVIVDGGNRLRCAETAAKVVAAEGFIIIDDSEGYWGPEGTHPIVELLDKCEFARIDFYGFAPGTYSLRCTSMFFRSTRLLRHLQPPLREGLLLKSAANRTS
jgi:hypothetical protein